MMASDPITSWQIEGENVEAVTDFIFFGSKITVDSNCSHKIKTCLLLAMPPPKPSKAEYPSVPYDSTWGPVSGSISITWELVRTENPPCTRSPDLLT